jgi:hypothetical protein
MNTVFPAWNGLLGRRDLLHVGSVGLAASLLPGATQLATAASENCRLRQVRHSPVDGRRLVKPTLYDLFDMHAEARGTARCTEFDRRDADTVFGLYEGITPFDTDRIMSEFMTNGTDQSGVQGNALLRSDI